MDIILMLALAGLVVWAVRRYLASRAPEPPEDEWVLPPESPGLLTRPPSAPDATDLGFQVLDRESLVNRDRILDPGKWDDSPDYPSGTEVTDPD